MSNELKNYKRRMKRAGIGARLVEECLRFVEQKTSVIIRYTNESGPWMWVVECVEDPDRIPGEKHNFWLDGFRTMERAQQFVKNLGLRTSDGNS